MYGGVFMLFQSMLNFIYLFLRVSGGQNFPPPLSPDEEKEYFKRARAGDALAREKLIEHNLRLVAHIVKKYYTANKNQEDLISVGTIGLIKAIDSYDIENGTKFATYAGKCLQNEILMYFRAQKRNANEVSINETIDIDKDGNPLTYIDIIACEDTIADDIDIKTKSAKALKIINSELSEREKEIIVMRYGIGHEKAITQREIAGKLGISRSYVSRIEKGALEKINELLSRPGFTMF
ncbi:MAG: sigma-70 family RNA polymerase sigma factor [Ruminococcaceae bacterium]|nr:sigma-70 family RNA polymerase sigma factor [Oscillospiraceae bacterium]